MAAWLVRHLPPQILGALAGGMIVLTNVRTLVNTGWVAVPGDVRLLVYLLVLLLWVAAVSHAVRRHRAEARAVDAEPLPVAV